MVDFSKLKIAVLMGGTSAERDVSLRSGRAASTALKSLGCSVAEIDVKDANPVLPADIQVAFLALHGTGGEDGVLQGNLEKRGIVFTGSGANASRLAFDKVAAKKAFRKAGLLVARDAVVSSRSLKLNDLIDLSFPRVVKPSKQGSSIGIHIVHSSEEMDAALKDAAAKDDEILVEEFIEGRELTVGILGNQALPVIEVRPKSGWYDYTNKYTKNATDYLVPAPIPQDLKVRVQEEALKAHRALGCRDMSRSDFRVNPANEIYILEVNTIPGMTETSLLPKAAAEAGITFPNLCLALVEQALNRGKERA